MNIKIISEAKSDYADILKYYVEVGNYEGDYTLALRFENEVLQAFEFIKQFPIASKVVYKNKIRSHYLNKFPVAILYEQKSDCILILSIYDQRRNPKFLTDRIKSTS